LFLRLMVGAYQSILARSIAAFPVFPPSSHRSANPQIYPGHKRYPAQNSGHLPDLKRLATPPNRLRMPAPLDPCKRVFYFLARSFSRLL
jgi:hypothetical protein